MATPPMTPTEFKRARDKTGWSVEELARNLGVSDVKVRAWEGGTRRVPKTVAARVRWFVADAERRAALGAAGLPECKWVTEWAERTETLTDPEDLEEHLQAFETHRGDCPTCRAREEYVAKRFPPMPPLPLGWMARAFLVFKKVPALLRPAVVGALILAAMVCIRTVFALPAIIENPATGLAALVALAAASGAGAIGGLAFALVRPVLRNLGRPGDYLTGIACMVAYLGALILAAPYAFGESLVNAPEELIIWGVMSVVFGLVVGHTWFGKKGLD